MTQVEREVTLIYNPTAGFRDWQQVIARVADYWRDNGWTVNIMPTSRTGHATELAATAAAAGQPMVLAAGGDGTLNEVANGLIGSETILAPLPVGTANSFAKELGLPRPHVLSTAHLLEVSRALVRGRIQHMDCGKTQAGRYWLLWASTGIDGFVVEQIEPRPRWFKRLGPAGYLARALFFVPQFRGFQAQVTVDDQQIDGDFLMVNISNCRMWMGGELRLNRNAVLDDGLFEVWLFRGRNWPRLLAYGIEIGLENHVKNEDVTVLRGQSVTIRTDTPMPYHLDGEPIDSTPLTVTLSPQVLRILVPETVPIGLFSAPGTPLSQTQPMPASEPG